MNYGPLIFLAGFFALSSSWFGFVVVPQIQLGRLQQTNTLVTAAAYPVARSGLAAQGREVYRANGCATCHSQQVGQTATMLNVVLTEVGTNPPALLAALKEAAGLSETQGRELLSRLPGPVLKGVTKEKAEQATKTLSASGAKAQLWVEPVGPDIARGWGKRHSVAEDYLYDDPVMLGSRRIGPDLANVGARLPDPNWHLRHLFAPRSEVKDSIMPSYPFLFKTRKVGSAPSSEALTFSSSVVPAGYEVVPTPEAKALVAYLLSLRNDAPLFSAPFSVASASAPATNTPAATATNAAPTNTPAK